MNSAQVMKFWEVLQFAFAINLFDLIGKEGIELNNLASVIGCDAKKLSYIIHILSLTDLLVINNEFIKNSDLSLKYLSDHYHNKISDLLIYNSQTFFSADRFAEVLGIKNKKSNAADDLYMSAMDIGSRYAAVKIASELLVNDNALMLDLGCGSGIFSLTACKYNKSLRAICVDKKNILEILEKKVKTLPSLNNRITLVAGDIGALTFEESKFDYVLLSNILHFFAADKIISILKNCYKWLKIGGKIIINDIFIDTNNLTNLFFALEWLANGNDFVQIDEMKKLLSKNGFTKIESFKFKQIPTEIIVALKPVLNPE